MMPNNNMNMNMNMNMNQIIKMRMMMMNNAMGNNFMRSPQQLQMPPVSHHATNFLAARRAAAAAAAHAAMPPMKRPSPPSPLVVPTKKEDPPAANATSTESAEAVPAVGPKHFANKILPLDILCGTDKLNRFDQHPGNVRYEQILNKVRAQFLSMESKSGKKKLVKEIDDFVSSYGGRFLRMDETTGESRLRVLTTAESRNKISRSLRESASSQQKNQSKLYIARVSELDVLCGRGGKANHHVGNKIYRQLICESKEKYRNTEDKDEKTELSRSIVEKVCDYGGRFVKKDSATGRYYVLPKAEARIKTSQALRENRDSKTGGAKDDDSCSESEAEEVVVQKKSQPKKKKTVDDLECCNALVSLSRATSE